MEPPRPQQPILLIEDSPEDVFTAKRNLLKSGLRNPIQVCETGEAALNYLYQRGEFADPNSAPAPGIILLDLNLPDIGGLEILLKIKQDPLFHSTPVIMMTSSIDERDFEECRQAGAHTYLVKPLDFLKLVKAIQDHRNLRFEMVFIGSSEYQEDIVREIS